jgi:hypothetical protein
MTRGQAEKLIDQLNSFWRERGYDPKAEIVSIPGGPNGIAFTIKTGLVNGLPPGFSSADRAVLGVVAVPISEIKFLSEN